MRFRVLLGVFVLLAFSGLRELDHGSVEPTDSTASSQLAAPPAPEPALPAVAPDATTTSPKTQTPLLSGWHRHFRPTDAATIVSRPASHSTTGAARPLVFPLLI